MPHDNGFWLTVGFAAGVAVGWFIGYVARKIYWLVKTPRHVRRHMSILRMRGYRSRARRKFSLRRLTMRSYSGYDSDYRLSKLFEKLDRADND